MPSTAMTAGLASGLTVPWRRAISIQGQLNPVAELDGADTIASRFVYGSKGNVVPDY